MPNVLKDLLSVMRACRQMGQFREHMAQSTPAAAKAVYKGAAAVKDADNSLNRLYEVVRAQQPHEGCPLSPQQVELICNVIGEGPAACCIHRLGCLQDVVC